MGKGRAPAGDKAAEADGDDRRLAAAREHGVRLAAADVCRGGMERVVGRRARGADAVVGAHEAVLDGNLGAAHVGDGVGDEEGRDLLVALRRHTARASVLRTRGE